MKRRFFKSVLAIVLIAVMMTTNAFMALAEITEPETAVTAEETVAAEEYIVEEQTESGGDVSAENSEVIFAEEVTEESDIGEPFDEDAVSVNEGNNFCDAVTGSGENNIGNSVTVSAGEGGTVTPAETVNASVITEGTNTSSIDISGYTFTIPSNVIIINDKEYEATAENGYIFDNWRIGNKVFHGEYAVEKGTKVTANFRKLWTVEFKSRGTNEAYFKDENIGNRVTEVVMPAYSGISLNDDDDLYVGCAKIRPYTYSFDFVCWEGLPKCNDYGNRTLNSNLTITAVFKPQITDQPENQEVITGQNACFNINVANMDYLTYHYQWQSSADGENWENITSATSNSYSVAATSNSQYRCLVSYGTTPTASDAATAISAVASLTVKQAAKSVTFDMQGHGAKVDGQSVTEGTAAIEPASPAAEGYIFGGWYRESLCENAWNFDWLITDNITLYAKWTAVAYKVVFNGNGATSGTMENQSRTYDDGKVLTANAFERTGYTFTGWNTKADGSGYSVKNNSVSNLRSTAGKITLYAQWEKNTYTITLKTSTGGEIKTATVLKNVPYGENYLISFDDSCLTVSTEDGNLVAERISEGYSCTGFTVNGKSNAPDSGKITENLEVEAVFKPIVYTVEFCEVYTVKGEKHEEIVKTREFRRGTEISLQQNGILIDSRTYLEVNDNPRFNFNGYTGIPENGKIQSDLVITANYTAKTYKITLKTSTGGEIKTAKVLKDVMYGERYHIDCDDRYLHVCSGDGELVAGCKSKWYTCTGFTVNGESNAPDSGEVAENLVIQAVFEHKNPEILHQPEDGKAYTDEELFWFHIDADWDGEIAYQWQYQTAGSTTWRNSAAASGKTNTLQIKVRSDINGCKYRCIVKDASDLTDKSKWTISNEATLTVKKRLVITSWPGNKKTALEGNTVTFSVAAEGDGDLTYQWQYKKTGSTKWVNSTEKSAKDKNYTVKAREELNGYKYRCVITDSKGDKVYSSPTTLKVE